LKGRGAELAWRRRRSSSTRASSSSSALGPSCCVGEREREREREREKGHRHAASAIHSNSARKGRTHLRHTHWLLSPNTLPEGHLPGPLGEVGQARGIALDLGPTTGIPFVLRVCHHPILCGCAVGEPEVARAPLPVVRLPPRRPLRGVVRAVDDAGSEPLGSGDGEAGPQLPRPLTRLGPPPRYAGHLPQQTQPHTHTHATRNETSVKQVRRGNEACASTIGHLGLGLATALLHHHLRHGRPPRGHGHTPLT
jgi:hypothetical protein